MTFLKLSVALLAVFLAGICCGTLMQHASSEAEAKQSKGVSLNNGPSSYATGDGPVEDCEPVFVKGDLIEASSKISELETQNMMLSRQIEHMELPISKNVTVPELMSRVDRLPTGLIYQQLERLFDREYLGEIEDPHEFAKQLIEVAVSEGKLVDTAVSAADSDVRIDFSFSPVAGLREFSNLDVVEQYDRIFVHFNTPVDYPTLIARWQHGETGEILQFSPLALQGNQENYISLEPRDGWKRGDYQVSVFDLGAGNRLVGFGSYRVDHVAVSETGNSEPDYEIIEDLLSAGHATPKSY